jgi:PemK-like protein.
MQSADMPIYQTGDVVYAFFPYEEDAEDGKDRTTLVLIPDLPAQSALVCMITHVKNRFDTCIPITNEDMMTGKLQYNPSYVRPYRVATISNQDIRRREGQAKPELVEMVRADLLKRLSKI